MNAQIDKEAGLYTQIRTLRKRIDSLDMGKVNPSELKSAIDSLKDLETRYADMQEKKKQRTLEKQNKEKEMAAQTVVSSEGAPEMCGCGHSKTDHDYEGGSTLCNICTNDHIFTPAKAASAPVAIPVEAAPEPVAPINATPVENANPLLAPVLTAEVEPVVTEKKAEEPKPEEKLEKIDLSKDPDFDSMMASALYMKMLEYLIMEEQPEHETVIKFKKAIERIQNEEDKEKLKAVFNEKFGGGIKTPWDYYSEAEKAPKETEIKPEAKTEVKADTSKFALDDLVEPMYGTAGSYGRVMRYDADKDMAYVHWDSGKLADDHGFGAYKGSDLKKRASIEKEAHVVEEDGKWYVYNHDKSKKLSKGYGSKSEAVKRLQQIEYFKHEGSLKTAISDTDTPETVRKQWDEHAPHFGGGMPHRWDDALDEKGKLRCSYCYRPQDYKPGSPVTPEQMAEISHVMGLDEPQSGQQASLKTAKLPPKKQKELDVIIQNAVQGYQIPMMQISEVYRAGEAAYLAGQDVTEAVKAICERIDPRNQKQGEPTDHVQVQDWTEPQESDPSEDKSEGYGGDRPGMAVAPKASLKTAEKLNVANREWEIVPKYELVGDSTKLVGYDIMADTGERAGFIKTQQPLNKQVIEQEIWNKLNGHNAVQATLKTNLSVLKKGHKVRIVSVDLKRKEAKFASLEMKSITGWTSIDKFNFIVEAKKTATAEELMPLSKTDKVIRVKSFQVLVDLEKNCPDCYKKWLKFASEKGLRVQADDLTDHVDQMRTKMTQTKEVLQTQTQAADTAPETVETEAALPPKPNITLPQGMKWMYNIDTNTWDMVTDSQFTF